MILNLKNLEFENDFFKLALPRDGYLVLNKVNENLTLEGQETAEVKTINIQVIISDNNTTMYTDCTNVIGLKDSFISISTDYKEYEGSVLNEDNMRFCTLEVLLDDNI